MSGGEPMQRGGGSEAEEPLGDPAGGADLTPSLKASLRRLRIRRGLSLERLARASGVRRAMYLG